MKRGVIALFLIFIGILGILLPVIPGIPFLIASLYVLGILNRKIAVRLLKKFKGKRNSVQRRIIGCIILKLVYKRRVNLK